MNGVIYYIFLTLAVIFCAGCGSSVNEAEEETSLSVVESLYGVDVEGYTLQEGHVRPGETMGSIMLSFGRGARDVDRVARASRGIFSLRDMRAGSRYVAFLTKAEDSFGRNRLDYIAYERDAVNYVLFVMLGDSVVVHLGEKPSVVVQQRRVAVVNSSLLGAIKEYNMPYELGVELENIYQWSINLFDLKRGDKFAVLYDEHFINDSISVGLGDIRGVKFVHEGVNYYAIPFKQGGRLEYWNEKGGSLKMNILKAPLLYSRTNSRLANLHSSQKHDGGVDYAVPTGTPVIAVGDGVVIQCGLSSDGDDGNIVKIQHDDDIVTGYAHLSRFARDVKVGRHLYQGDLVGYVGSSGEAEEPHLDYRVWVGGKSISPIDVIPHPMDPISEVNKRAFDELSRSVVSELDSI